MCSIYEFIYSCRESFNSPFPEISSQETINALKMMKKVKDEISSDIIFQSDDAYTKELLKGKDYIFLKYWYMPSSTISKTVLPGIKDGLSGTTIGGYNIGIGDYLSKSKRKAAVEALRYMTSKEIQKSFIIERGLFSGILELYEDEDVCNAVDCEFFKSFQPIARPTNKTTTNYDSYSFLYRKYIYDYLYDDRNIDDAIKSINDILKFYSISVSPKDSPIGLLYFIFIIILAILMLISYAYVFINRYKVNFEFLSKDLWLSVIVGCVMILCSGLWEYGEVTSTKCQLKFIFLSLGYTFITMPLLYKLAKIYPNKYFKWISSNKVIYLATYLLIGLITLSLFFIISIDVKNQIIADGKNFKYCRLDGFVSYLMLFILFLLNFITTFAIIILGAMAWNNKETRQTIRFIWLTVLIDIALYIMILFVNYVDFKNYIACFVIHQVVYTIISLSNYILIYGFRILMKNIENTKNIDIS
eukprot:jgi/Orpsp1_1/1191687/evm.model.d7180000087806.1